MENAFEDEFMGVQEDLIALSLEYVDSKAEKVFVYGSIEKGSLSMNTFYFINGRVVWPNEVNEALLQSQRIDDSSDRQIEMLSIGADDLKRLVSICEKYEKPVPSEVKLIFDNETKEFNACYRYNDTLEDLDTDPYDAFESWVEEEKKLLES